MAVCKGSTKCYQTKKKKCMKPNAWLIFLRANKHNFKTIGQASKKYRDVFRPEMKKKALKIAGEYSTDRQKKEAMHNLLCRTFYKNLKKEKKTAVTKKKLSKDVAKILKTNSIPKTLVIIVGKKTADAVVAKKKATDKAAADVAAKKRVAETKKKMAAMIIKKALLARGRAKKLEREAIQAKVRANWAAKAANYNAPKARRSSGSTTRASARQSKTTAQKRASAASAAKRKADTLEKSADKAAKKVKTAEKAVVSAKKTQSKVAKKKIPRALAGLQNNLIMSSSGGRGKRRRRA